jgi:hypothetical protein
MKINNARRIIIEGQVLIRFETDRGIVDSLCAKDFILQTAALVAGPVEPEPVTLANGDFHAEGFTTEPVILEVSRRWGAGMLEGYAPGEPIPVPSFAEADSAIWRMKGARLVKKS